MYKGVLENVAYISIVDWFSRVDSINPLKTNLRISELRLLRTNCLIIDSTAILRIDLGPNNVIRGGSTKGSEDSKSLRSRFPLKYSYRSVVRGRPTRDNRPANGARLGEGSNEVAHNWSKLSGSRPVL